MIAGAARRRPANVCAVPPQVYVKTDSYGGLDVRFPMSLKVLKKLDAPIPEAAPLEDDYSSDDFSSSSEEEDFSDGESESDEEGDMMLVYSYSSRARVWSWASGAGATTLTCSCCGSPRSWC